MQWLWILLSNAGDARDAGLIPGLGRSPGGGNSNPLQYFLPEKLQGQTSLAGYSSTEGCKESDTTKHAHPHTWSDKSLHYSISLGLCLYLFQWKIWWAFFKRVIKKQFLEKYNDGMIFLSDITKVNRVNSTSNTWKPHTSLLK